MPESLYDLPHTCTQSLFMKEMALNGETLSFTTEKLYEAGTVHTDVSGSSASSPVMAHQPVVDGLPSVECQDIALQQSTAV